MSPIGRIFIVLNLVLAVAFLGWASANLANSQDYKALLDVEQTEHLATKDRLETELSAARTEKNQFEKDLADARTQKDRIEAERTRLESDLKGEQERNNTLAAEVEKIAATLSNYDATNRELADKLEAANTALAAAQDARHEAQNERQTATEAQADLQRELELANDRVASLEEQLTSVQQSLDDKDVALQTLVEHTGTDPREIMAMPQIDGAVMNVSHAIEPGLVAINRGSDDGVKRGFTFDVYSAGQFKGRVRVETVQPDMCTAVILKTFAGRTIEQGDSASTRI